MPDDESTRGSGPATERAPVDRRAARVLLVDIDGAVLLLRGRDSGRPGAGWWWFTPGGGIDDGESAIDAARREVREETGLEVGELGPVVFRRVAHFAFEGTEYRQHEQFFCVRTGRFDIDDRGWSDVERRTMFGHRWWTRAELRVTDETIYPEQLVQLLDDILGGAD